MRQTVLGSANRIHEVRLQIGSGLLGVFLEWVSVNNSSAERVGQTKVNVEERVQSATGLDLPLNLVSSYVFIYPLFNKINPHSDQGLLHKGDHLYKDRADISEGD